MTDHIALVTCGPVEHGIARFGRDLAGDAVAAGFTGPVLHEPDPHRLVDSLRRLPPDVRLVHLQANDWLFTDAAHRADESIRSLAAVLRERSARLSLTLHDLPHQAVPRELFLRRARTYADMMAEAVTVVVSSEHERLLIEEAASAVRAADGPDATAHHLPVVKVIPLPVPDSPAADSAGSATIDRPAGRVVGILGYLYPGKGHRQVLEELTGADPPFSVVAIGRPSDGHDGLLPELIELGRELGVGFSSTGFVPDDQLPTHLQAVSVAVAPASHVSASASINAWLASGRRPLVAAGRYADELAARMPGSITIYRPGELLAHVEAALARDSLTRLAPGFRPYPHRREVASRYLRWLRSTAASATGPDS